MLNVQPPVVQQEDLCIPVPSVVPGFTASCLMLIIWFRGLGTCGRSCQILVGEVVSLTAGGATWVRNLVCRDCRVSVPRCSVWFSAGSRRRKISLPALGVCVCTAGMPESQ